MKLAASTSLLAATASSACTDVTAGITGLNAWACRACKRVRASFNVADFGMDGFDSSYTMDLMFPSGVTPRQNVNHPVASVTSINDRMLRVHFAHNANFGNGQVDFTIELKYEGTEAEAPILTQAIACGATTTAATTTATSEATTAATSAPTTAPEMSTAGDDCSGVNIMWKQRKNWWKYTSFSSSLSFHMAMDEKHGMDLINDAYVGLMTFSKKVCGADFMTAFGDGRVTYSIDDKIDLYCTKPQYNYYLNDGHRSKLALQFYFTGLSNKGGGKQPHLSKKKKHDTFYFSLHGLDKVDFEGLGKNKKDCLMNMRIGVMADDGGAIDHTKCAAELGATRRVPAK